MAIEKANILSAAGNFSNTGGGVTTVNFSNGCLVARTLAGTFTITDDTALASSSAVMLIYPQVAGGVAIYMTVVQTSATVWTVTTSATLGGAAADIATTISFAVLAIGQPGTSGV